MVTETETARANVIKSCKEHLHLLFGNYVTDADVCAYLLGVLETTDTAITLVNIMAESHPDILPEKLRKTLVKVEDILAITKMELSKNVRRE